jgi:hypothetical protein
MLESRKKKKCRSCQELFIPVRPLQSVCSPACAAVVVLKAKTKRESKAKSEDRKATREAKEKIKTRGEHLAELQTVFNQWIRLRDANEPCISCGRLASWPGQWDAGHYRSRGSEPALRFEPDNVHKQCGPCNVHLSGNLIPYRVKLMKKIGAARVEWIEGKHGPKKYTMDEIAELKAFYREVVRRIKKSVL